MGTTSAKMNLVGVHRIQATLAEPELDSSSQTRVRELFRIAHHCGQKVKLLEDLFTGSLVPDRTRQSRWIVFPILYCYGISDAIHISDQRGPLCSGLARLRKSAFQILNLSPKALRRMG